MYTYRAIPRGSVKNVIYVELRDAATPFQPKTGFAFNSGGIAVSYLKKRGARVAITPVTQTVSAAWTSGGVIEVDATNMPGVVRLDVPDAAFTDDGASDEVIIVLKATGFEPKSIRIPLVDKADVFISPGTTRTNS